MTAPLYLLTDVWNNATQRYDAIAMDVADANHAIGSNLLDLKVNGVSQFSVLAPDASNPNGGLLFANDLHFFRETDPPVVRGALAMRDGTTPQVFRIYNTYTDDNNWERAGVGWTLSGNILGVGMVCKGSGQPRPMILLGSNILLSRTGDPTVFTPDMDTGVFRNAAGVMEVNSGQAGNLAGAYLKWGGTSRAAADWPTSVATLADAGGLSVSVKAGRAYAFEAELSFTCAAAGGIKCAIGGNATATNIIYDGWIVDSAANGIKGNAQATAMGAPVAAAATVGTAGHVTIRGTIEVNAAGTLTVQAAQNTVNATATVVKRGSRLIVHDVT